METTFEGVASISYHATRGPMLVILRLFKVKMASFGAPWHGKNWLDWAKNLYKLCFWPKLMEIGTLDFKDLGMPTVRTVQSMFYNDKLSAASLCDWLRNAHAKFGCKHYGSCIN